MSTLLTHYQKALAVVKSCKTTKQQIVADMYIALFSERMKKLYDYDEIYDYVNELYNLNLNLNPVIDKENNE